MSAHSAASTPRASRGEQAVTLLGVLIPFLGLLFAIVSLWGSAVGWMEVTVLIVMYLAAGLGVTVGYHRLFAHRAFETFRPIKLLFGALGSMAVQGPVIKWTAVHRRHHQHSDQEEDPHSPHRFGGGVRGVLAGFWHAHIGWMFEADPPNLGRYVRDLSRDRLVRVLSRLFGLWVLLGLLIPTGIGAWVTGTWTGALLGLLWGGLARIALGHHVTWSINSVCHLWGRRPYPNNDESRNNAVFGFLALGEGWHNNHHAFPASARHGLRWWEFDLSYLVIQVLKWLRLAWDVRLPSPQAMQRLARSAPA